MPVAASSLLEDDDDEALGSWLPGTEPVRGTGARPAADPHRRVDSRAATVFNHLADSAVVQTGAHRKPGLGQAGVAFDAANENVNKFRHRIFIRISNT